MGIQANHGYNVGLELMNCYTKTFDHREVKLHELIDNLKMINIRGEIVDTLMNKLSHAKRDDEKRADLINDEMVVKCAYLLHLRNTTIFEEKIHGVEGDMTLDRKLQEIVDQLKGDGVPEKEINLAAVLDKIEVGSVQIDALSEDDVDILIQGLDAEAKIVPADLNECMMKVNNEYENRSQLTESARQLLKTVIEHTESIIHRTVR
jgi:hypothetical protein